MSTNDNLPTPFYIAVIDVETNWTDGVMSIGLAIANAETYHLEAQYYYEIDPDYKEDGMYSDSLFPAGIDFEICSREDAIHAINEGLSHYKVLDLFAYNAPFDRRHLPELEQYNWYDIMRIAAYRQHNSNIPKKAPLHQTGRLKWGYDFESMYQLASKDRFYSEPHCAVLDAIDELHLMKMLGHPIEYYRTYGVKKERKSREQYANEKKELLQERLIERQLEIVSLTKLSSPVLIRCQNCGYEWEVSYKIAQGDRICCPQCHPVIRVPKKRVRREKTAQEIEEAAQKKMIDAQRRADNYHNKIAVASGGALNVISFNGSRENVIVVCNNCSNIWSIRADHLAARCYCPKCRKTR